MKVATEMKIINWYFAGITSNNYFNGWNGVISSKKKQ